MCKRLQTLLFYQIVICLISANARILSFKRPQDMRTPEEPSIDPQTLPKMSYKGYQLWKIKTDTAEKQDALDNLDIVEVTRWGVNRSNSDILISSENLDKVKDDLNRNQIKHQVLIKDLEEAMEDGQIRDTDEMKLSQKIENFNLSSYHKFDVIRNYLRVLAEQHGHVKIKTIGKTRQNNPLEVVIISSGGNKKGVFIEAGIHAREWISPASVLYVISHLVNHLNEESITMRKIDWYFLPIGNPDGYIFSYTKDRLWRKNRSEWGNCFGTDLNRNFGFAWDNGDGDACSETFSGSGPFSEPETKAIKDFIQKFDSDYWSAYISIHSYGQYVLYPYGFANRLPENGKELKRVARMAVEAMREPFKTEYQECSVADIYIAAGVSVDWTVSLGIRYSFTIELRDKGKYAFMLPEKYIVPTGQELLNAIRVIAESAYKDFKYKKEVIAI